MWWSGGKCGKTVVFLMSTCDDMHSAAHYMIKTRGAYASNRLPAIGLACGAKHLITFPIICQFKIFSFFVVHSRFPQKDLALWKLQILLTVDGKSFCLSVWVFLSGSWWCWHHARGLLQWSDGLQRQTEDQPFPLAQSPQGFIQTQQLLHQNKTIRGTVSS